MKTLWNLYLLSAFRKHEVIRSKRRQWLYIPEFIVATFIEQNRNKSPYLVDLVYTLSNHSSP